MEDGEILSESSQVPEGSLKPAKGVPSYVTNSPLPKAQKRRRRDEWQGFRKRTLSRSNQKQDDIGKEDEQKTGNVRTRKLYSTHSSTAMPFTFPVELLMKPRFINATIPVLHNLIQKKRRHDPADSGRLHL
ncbi:hypothetical protein BDV93DRAFT_567175 [Ceratobasidium sp. AG-I]|nr:hypothetical protein BDV93DRAFT_567175 [Ceratobasidium sp. AG-I]